MESHSIDYHPEVPSFRDQYKLIEHKVSALAYEAVFNPRQLRYITGGIATQFYIPPEIRRGSNDIDVHDLRRRTWPEFEACIREDLRQVKNPETFRGFDLVTVRRNHSYVLHICNWFKKDKNERYFFNVEFPRHTAGHHRNHRETWDREYEKSHEYRVNDTYVRVLNPTDIIRRKLQRLYNYQMGENIQSSRPPESLTDHLNLIWQAREAIAPFKNCFIQNKCKKCEPMYRELHTKLRLLCDQYDIRSLLIYARIDEAHLIREIQELMVTGNDLRVLFSIIGDIPEFD